MPKPRPCRGGRNGPGCGQAIVLVQTAKGGVIPLELYPVLARDASPGVLRVDVVPHGLVLLGRDDPSSALTKLYERHVCVRESR
jgi:hypothetical protein